MLQSIKNFIQPSRPSGESPADSFIQYAEDSRASSEDSQERTRQQIEAVRARRHRRRQNFIEAHMLGGGGNPS